jgi:hypothetical protein
VYNTFVKKGTTTRCFRNEGKLQISKPRLNMWHKRGVNISEESFVITLGISSGLTHCMSEDN